jgi:hypothetical protein
MNMKHKRFAGVALGTLVIAFAALTGAHQSEASAKEADTKASVDVRTPLVLGDADRHLVLDEMRNFLHALQLITDALKREDMQGVAAAARKMGSGAANEIPPATVALLPQYFIELAGETHTAFDLIAMDAEVMDDQMHTVSQISELLMRCNACHATYQIQLKD